MTYYHITERDNLPNIRRYGLRPKVSPAYEHEGVRAIFLTKRKPSSRAASEDILYWEDLLDPIILVIDLPSRFLEREDEAGMKVYPEMEPVYVTRTIPPKYVREVLEVPR